MEKERRIKKDDEINALITELNKMEMSERHEVLVNLISGFANATEQECATIKIKLKAIMDNFLFYMSRDIYINTNGDHDKMIDLLASGRAKITETGDPEEHPGICIRYKRERI